MLFFARAKQILYSQGTQFLKGIPEQQPPRNKALKYIFQKLVK